MSHARLAYGFAALALVLCAVGVVFTLLDRAHLPGDNVLGNVLFVSPIVAFAVVGALIGARRPENSVGWLCLAIGVLFGIVVAGDALSSWGVDTGNLSTTACAWLGCVTASWVPALGLMGTQLPLRLPDGHPLTRRWALYGRVCAVALALVTVVMFLQPDDSRLPNPIGVDAAGSLGFLFLAIPLLTLGGIASVVVRYRRSVGVERLQLRWVAVGAVAFLAPYAVVLIVVVFAGVDDGSTAGIIITGSAEVAYAAIPVGIGFAVLRYRLYDLDVVINRALVYTALTATLAAAYGATVLVFQLVLAPLTNDSGLAVAASTLAVAGLFGPARARIQAAVDRRFYRRKYDAARTLEAFNARLRDELDLDSLSEDLRAVVHRTMQPAHVSVWLKDAAR